MKRSFPEGDQVESLSMANCLILLSKGQDPIFDHHHDYHVQSIVNSNINTMMTTNNRVFECKTCNRQFPSFQALGGHRASHKKPRITEGSGDGSPDTTSSQFSSKPKTHECSICGLEFAIGQALGGHMRRHRAAGNNNIINMEKKFEKKNSVSSSIAADRNTTPVLKKSGNGRRRVLCLDLNLTPYENDLKELNNYTIRNKATSTPVSNGGLLFVN